MPRTDSLPGAHRLQFCGLRKQPFATAPDCHLVPFGRKRREVLASLYLGVLRNRNFLTLIAPDGLGKTLLLQQLATRLRIHARIALLLSAPRSRCGLLRGALEGFGFPSAGEDRTAMRNQLRRLATREREAGRRSVLIVDDAHDLDVSALDEIQLLSSPGAAPSALLQVVLAGSPSLTDVLREPGLVTLRRRMTPAPPLEPLSAVDTADYIDYRLWAAGYDAPMPLFTPEAVKRVTAATNGVPRRIDIVCTRALTLGCLRRVTRINRSIVEEAIASLGPDSPRASLVPDGASEVRSLEPLPMAVGQGSMLVFPIATGSGSTRQAAWAPARPASAQAAVEPSEVPPVLGAPRHQDTGLVSSDAPCTYAMPADSPQLSKLVQSLLAAQNDPAPRSILFASVDQGAQTAQLCADVAKVLAAGTSRVVVLNADRHLSTLHEQFGVGTRPGLADVLDRRVSTEDAVVAVGPKLSLLTSGRVTGSGTSCLLPAQVADLVSELKGRFDYVLVNGMPLNQGSDSLVFAKSTEGVLLVVAAHATERVAARQARDRLEAAGVRLLGAVLTGRTFPVPDAIYRRL